MRLSPRRGADRRSPCARPTGLILLACGWFLGPMLVPAVARAEAAQSCLVLPTEPTLEWTLVSYAPEAGPVPDAAVDSAGAELPLVAVVEFDTQPSWNDGPGTYVSDVLVAPPSSTGGQNIYFKAWLPITIGELSLLTITAMMPKDWTGWSANFVGEGAAHFAEAWSKPPVMDTDHWFHNYVGHPYGGSFYYNSVRTRGAAPMSSMAFAAALSFQWEYIFEAVAERPSIQDLVITPIAGAALGELTHRMSRSMRKGRVTLPEKVIMTVLNPADVLAHGYKSSD